MKNFSIKDPILDPTINTTYEVCSISSITTHGFKCSFLVALKFVTEADDDGVGV